MLNKRQSLPLLLVAAIVGVLAFMVVTFVPHGFSADQAPAMSALEKTLLQAETSADKEQGIALLKTLLSDPKVQTEEAGKTVSADYIRAAVVESYLDLFANEQDADHLEKARVFARQAYDLPYDKAWAYIEMLNRISAVEGFSANSGAQNLVSELIDDTQTEAQNAEDGEMKDRLYYALALLLTETREKKPVFDKDSLSQVHLFVGNISSSKHRLQVMKRLAELGETIKGIYPDSYAELYKTLAKDEVSVDDLKAIHDKAVEADQFDLAVTSLMMIPEQDDRTEALFGYFEKLFDAKDISRARRIAEVIDNPAKGVNAWSELAGFYLINGYDKESAEAYKKAESFIPEIRKDDSRKRAEKLIKDRKERDTRKAAEKKSHEVSGEDRKLAEKAVRLFEKDELALAVAQVREIEDVSFRVETFRQFAEKQTAKNDKYGLLEAKDAAENAIHVIKSHEGKIVRPDPAKVQDYESETTKDMDENPQGLIIREGFTPSDIGSYLSHEPLIARLDVTPADVRRDVPLPGDYTIVRSYYENTLYAGKFSEVLGSAGFTRQQGTSAPDVVVADDGIVDIPALYDYLKNQGLDDYMTRKGRVYILRRPLIVNPNATLIISGHDVDALLLSADTGAFIAGSGTTYIVDTKVVGWSEKKDEPLWAQYHEKREFRPFMTFWSQSNTYIANSELIALGYGNGKSYGLSFSAGPSNWMKYGNKQTPMRPTATIVNTSHNNMLYGFYSYEADDVIISGNEYIENVVYGVDPHDRSLRLAIGYNTAYDTHKKHGIIISREVNDSIIFGNLSFDNKGTGIMLDRDSNGTLVYGNTAFHNKQEGMTIFESDCEIIAANKIYENKGSGFRIRNSYNIGLFYNDVVKNRASGIAAYNGTLKGDPVHAHRDFALDPYDELTTVTAVGNVIQENGTGLNIDKVSGLFLKENKFILQSPKVLRGTMFQDNPELLFRYDQERFGTSVNASCPSQPEPLYVQTCKYREKGILSGDGMDNLTDRVKVSACSKSTTDIKPSYHETGEDHEDDDE